MESVLKVEPASYFTREECIIQKSEEQLDPLVKSEGSEHEEYTYEDATDAGPELKRVLLSAERGQTVKRKRRKLQSERGEKKNSKRPPLDPNLAGTEVVKGCRTYCCRACAYKTVRREDMRVHLSTHSGHKPYKCKICPHTCALASRLKAHMRTHSGERNYKCTLCPMAFISRGSLQRHMLTHFPIRPHVCPVCYFAFKHAYDLKNHLSTHTGEKRFECDVCGSKFRTVVDIKQHMAVHTVTKRYVCPTCPYSCRRPNVLRSHLRTHTDVRLYECGVCGRGFKSSQNLRVHKATHMDFKPFRCDSCDFQSRHKNILVMHVMRKHLGVEPPLECAHCRYRAFSKAEMVRHQSSFNVHSFNVDKTQTDLIPYECSVCQRRYRLSCSLKAHMACHSDQKFRCDSCDFQTVKKHNLIMHVARRHSGVGPPLQCAHCQYRCFTKTEMARHQRSAGEHKTKLKRHYQPLEK